MVNRVFVFVAAQETSLAFFAKPGGSGPSAPYGVPAGVAYPWCQVGHDEPKVVLASFRVDPWEARNIPFFYLCAELFCRVVCGGRSEGSVDVVLSVLFPSEMVFFGEGEWCLFGDVGCKAVVVNISLLHVLNVVIDR